MESLEFPAKVDWWFLLLFYGLGLWMIVLSWFLRSRGLWVSALLIVLGTVFVGIGWTTDRMVIVITPGGELDVRGWPYGGRITRLDEIHSIVPSNDPQSSLAASLDRLRIDYGNGSRIFIAVRDKPAFLDAVAASSDHLVRTENGVRQSEP